MAAAPLADQIARTPVAPADTDLAERYIERAAGVRRSVGSVRVALTPMHGVGGAVAVETLRRAGFHEVHAVGAQFAPDPDFPTVAFPNPEEPGATDALLALAADVDADVAIALDPDADRCAVGVPTGSGWRMLSGDETGWLLGDYLLSRTDKSGGRRGGQHRGVVADAGGDRRALRRDPRRDPHRVQVAGARRFRRARRHPGVRLRGSDRALRRPGRRARQRRHQRRGAGVRSGGDAQRAGSFGARRARRSRPAVRRARRRGGVAPGRRRRRGRRTDAAAAGGAAEPAGRVHR